MCELHIMYIPTYIPTYMYVCMYISLASQTVPYEALEESYLELGEIVNLQDFDIRAGSRL